MPTSFEAEISSLLQSQGDAEKVADELLSRLSRNLLTDAEARDAYQFLLAAGFLPRIFKAVEGAIDRTAIVPWAQFSDAIGLANIRPDEFEAQAIYDAAESQQALDDLVRSVALDEYHAGFKDHRGKVAEARARETNERRQSLKDKLAYMRAHRLFEQEAQVLDELQALFPDESDIKSAREALEIRWAREVIANSVASSDPTADLQFRVDSLTPELAAMKNLLTQRARELAEGEPRLAYDLAASLHMMDFNNEALQILAYARGSKAADWLRLELMVRSRQFVSALDEAAKLEAAYADDPDAAFAAAYARARALHGLGQSAQAIELLRSLLRIRPHYKSAQSLLTEWAGSDA